MPKTKILPFLKNRWLMSLLLHLIGIGVYGQNIQGRVVDQEGGVSQIEIRNLSNGLKTFSDDAGNFELQAKVEDSLSFESAFYFREKIKLSRKDFKEGVHLKVVKRDFNLDEITLIAPSQKFDSEKYDTDLKLLVKNDMEKNPALYSPGSKIGTGVNILGIVDLAVTGVSKLFGIKKKETAVVGFITVEDLEALFKKDSFFNDQLLHETMKIEEDQKYIFFTYCEERYISDTFLKPENQFLLLDELVSHAKKFRAGLTLETE